MIKKDSTIFSAVKALLYPVVRLALRHGLRYQEINSCVKEVLVYCAEKSLADDDLPFTVSRASVITGLQRKDIKRMQDPNQALRTTTSLLTRVIGTWDTNPAYRNRDGSIRDLTFEGVDSQFAELVREISADVSHYTVLFGLETSGSIEKHGGLIHLKRSVYIPSDNLAEKFDILAQDSEDLIRAVEENANNQESIPNLHVTTVFDNIRIDKLGEIRDHILTLGSDFHQKIREYLANLDKDSNPSIYKTAGGGRVVVGSFSLTENCNREK